MCSFARPGPTASRAELEHVVADLREAAERARPIAVRAARLGTVLEAADAGEGSDYESPPEVDFRGDFKPELVQLLIATT